MSSESASAPSTRTEQPSLSAPRASSERQLRQRRRARAKAVRQALLVLLLLAAAIGVVLSLRPNPVPVDVARVELGPLVVAVEESGRTRVKHRYVVSAPTTGRLSRIELEPGDEVKEGDVLAEISPAPSPLLDARTREQADARLGAALSALGQARTQLTRARTAKEQADRDLARTRTLVASGSLPAQALEQAEFTSRMQADELASAEFAVKVANEEARLARAALGGKDAGANDSRHIDVLAPASGRVLRVHRESAGLVEAGTPLVEVGDPALLEGVVDLLTTDAVNVHPGTPVVIQGWGGESAFDGRVVEVEPSAFTRPSALGVEEQRVNVILALTGPREQWGALGDGYHIEARIILWQSDRVLKAPIGAVFRQGNGWAAFRLEGSEARLVPISIGHRGETEVEVLSGLDLGDVVVVHPGDRVKDGARVEVRG